MKWCGILILILLFSVSATKASPAVNPVTNVCTVKARELTAGISNRWQKMNALHVFVRDDIKQIKTQYG
jgi:hypothetical protein